MRSFRRQILVLSLLCGVPLLLRLARADDAAHVTASLTAGDAHSAGSHRTFARDIAPIVFDNCATCHHEGQVAPFSLMSYKDVKKRAGQIAAVTESRYMPPWKPEPGHGDFVGQRRLSDAQVRMIQDWVKQGAPEGDASGTPPAPKFTDGGWQLGPPDLIVKMPKVFNVQAEGRDEFRSFVIPLDEKELPADKYVTAVEFRASNPKVVHHALIFLDSSGEARKLDGQDGQPGWTRGAGGLGFLPSGGLGGWSPGVTPRPLPDGVARPLRKGSDIVLQMHFHPTGRVEQEQSTLALYFAKKPPQKLVVSFPKASRPLNIPAGDRNYVLDDSFEIHRDVTLIGIFPHAHLLCREIKVDADLPGGQTVPLIWIKDWDWNWQDMYLYHQALHIPAGTRVRLHYVYDNSSDNVRNPSDPPKRVTWGEQTSDEMAVSFFQIELDASAYDGLLNLRRFQRGARGAP